MYAISLYLKMAKFVHVYIPVDAIFLGPALVSGPEIRIRNNQIRKKSFRIHDTEINASNKINSKMFVKTINQILTIEQNNQI